MRRKKARRSPSLMSRRTLQPSHASRRIGGGGVESIGVGEKRELELGRKLRDDKGLRSERVGSGRVGSGRIPPNQAGHPSLCKEKRPDKHWVLVWGRRRRWPPAGVASTSTCAVRNGKQASTAAGIRAANNGRRQAGRCSLTGLCSALIRGGANLAL